MSTSNKKPDDVIRAEKALKLRDFETAEKLARKLVLESPLSRDYRMLLGMVYLRTNRQVDALAAFSSIVEINPKDVRALEGMAIAYLRQGKALDALSALEHAIDYDSTDAELLYNLGNVHNALGNLRAAEMSFAKAVEIDPTHVMAYNNLGTTYLNMNDPAKSVQVFCPFQPWPGL